MIAGTLALLEAPAREPLESYGSGGFATLDVRNSQEYLDGSSVQEGAAAGTVEQTQEEIHVTGTDIDVEEIPANSRVYTEWVADVVDAGFIVSERTSGTDPTFPFDLFRARLGTDVRQATIYPDRFVRAQERSDDLAEVWYAGTKMVTDSDREPDDVEMGYGTNASRDTAREANIGVGFKTSWRGTVVKGTLYRSGYVAIYNDSWGPVQFARFVADEILPHAEAPDPDDDTEQETLGGEA